MHRDNEAKWGSTWGKSTCMSGAGVGTVIGAGLEEVKNPGDEWKEKAHLLSGPNPFLFSSSLTYPALTVQS